MLEANNMMKNVIVFVQHATTGPYKFDWFQMKCLMTKREQSLVDDDLFELFILPKKIKIKSWALEIFMD